eukprot:TRINITY_DN13579_c0_g1_i1.p1 TRINITY_DN13579_c0_g1~~TRINITY_DN13579_c0_g1_i1.p1  ORF type:complete len:402 (+),score=35.43 TRINITY_DN13579_c0_g1_i1:30-1208(+)
MPPIPIPPMPSVRDICRMYGLTTQKSLSQNFIFDQKITDAIAHRCDIRDRLAVEIGPGPGGLTRSLLKHEARGILTIEKDPRFVEPLSMLTEASAGRVANAQGDVLDADEHELLRQAFPHLVQPAPWEGRSGVVLVGNLPFAISTPLLIKWLRQVGRRTGLFALGRVEMVLMFQKEVADRITCSGPGSKEWSRLSIMSQNYCHTRQLLTLKSTCFIPPPKVECTLVRLQPRITPLASVSVDILEQFCLLAFSHRRKTFVNSLECAGVEKDVIRKIVDEIQVDPRKRTEALSVEHIAKMAEIWNASRTPQSDSQIVLKLPNVNSFDLRADQGKVRLLNETTTHAGAAEDDELFIPSTVHPPNFRKKTFGSTLKATPVTKRRHHRNPDQGKLMG